MSKISQLYKLRNKTVHVIGLSGTEGSSLALFLIKAGFKNLIGHDFSNKPQFEKNYSYYHQSLNAKQQKNQIKEILSGFKIINYKNDYLNNIEEADLVLAPSSWFRYKINNPLKKVASRETFWNWYNLLLEFFPGTLIGVTGTAGKGTVTNLIYQILKTANRKVWLAGESWEMMPLYEMLNANKSSLVVAELSNRTLTFASHSRKSPAIAVITNITKNHLDDHQGSFQKYISVKKQIAKYQTASDFLIFNSLNEQTKKLKNFGKAKKIPYSYKNPESKLINNSSILGQHLIGDAVAAIKVSKILKISKPKITEGLNKFNSRVGRMQVVGKKRGLTFINDGASTRPEATIEALKCLPKNKVHLILEGMRYKPDKKQFLKLVETIKNQKVKEVAVSGKISNFLYPLLKKISVKILKSENLRQSIRSALTNAKAEDIILLSPGCESFGEFKDYTQRIAAFEKIINQL